MRIEIVTKRGWFRTRWYWRIKGGNGEVLAHSEMYASHQKAQQTAHEVKRQGHVGLPILEVAE